MSTQPEFLRYAILLHKVEGRPAAPESIRLHIEHLQKLDQRGQLVLAGPFTDFPSGMVVVKARDKAEAIAIAEADPFVQEGVRSFEVRTWMLACAENGYLG